MVNPIKTLINDVSNILSALNPEQFNSFYESKVLVKHFLDVTDVDIALDDIQVNETIYESIISLAKKRATGYPLQYILGEWEFYGLPFLVGEGVLIPRADTECLCETIIEHIGSTKGMKIADLCSGSGCIAITIDKFCSNNNVYAIEKSNIACTYLLDNIELNQSNVSAINLDIFDPNSYITDLDIIVSNPPYLTKQDMLSLQKEVSFEPDIALVADDNGLYFYKKITSLWKHNLKKGGLLCFEIGEKQHEQVIAILKDNGFINIFTKKDLCGVIRVVCGIYDTQLTTNR